METGLLHLHNLLRWVILILLVISIIKSVSGWVQKKAFVPGDKKIWLFTMIAAHITLVIGLFQWLAGRFGLLTQGQGMGSMMKNTVFRFYQLEHPLTMIIAIVMITLGHGMAKKSVPDNSKYSRASIYFLIALILILVRTPWPFMQEVGRPWFPGM